MIELKTPQSTNFCHRGARASVLARTPSDCGLVGRVSSLPPGVGEGSSEPRATRGEVFLVGRSVRCGGQGGPAGTATALPRIYLPSRQITPAPVYCPAAARPRSPAGARASTPRPAAQARERRLARPGSAVVRTPDGLRAVSTVDAAVQQTLPAPRPCQHLVQHVVGLWLEDYAGSLRHQAFELLAGSRPLPQRGHGNVRLARLRLPVGEREGHRQGSERTVVCNR